ncbi:oxidoreductase [Mycena galericulata]|nr:oxidoreductase [Mycena galericulata]
MPTVLIVGATRGLGAALASAYASVSASAPSGPWTIYATSRAPVPPPSHSPSILSPTPTHEHDSSIRWIFGIDIASESAGRLLASALPPHALIDVLIVCAGYFSRESFEAAEGETGGLNWGEEIQMYTTGAVGPLFVVQALVAAGKIKTSLGDAGVGGSGGGKIILISSEAGSIGLRHEGEGGGNYAHHASKTALNMVGKLLSLDLKERGIAVGIVHPGFMRTDMTKNVGYDQFWDSGGAIPPSTAAASLLPFIDAFTLEMSGQFWAPRGLRCALSIISCSFFVTFPHPLPPPHAPLPKYR